MPTTEQPKQHKDNGNNHQQNDPKWLTSEAENISASSDEKI